MDKAGTFNPYNSSTIKQASTISFDAFLSGGDRRSIGGSQAVVELVHTQEDFDALFAYLFRKERLTVMRAANAVEKITIAHPEYLVFHKREVVQLCRTATDKELKWHLALMLPRLPFTEKELGTVWTLLTNRAKEKGDSRIVRVYAVQGLYDLLHLQPHLQRDLELTMEEMEGERIPSLTARVKKIRKALTQKKRTKGSA